MTLIEGATPTADNMPARLPNKSSHHSSPNVPPVNEYAGKGKITANLSFHEATSKCHQPTHLRPLEYAQLRSTNQRGFLSSPNIASKTPLSGHVLPGTYIHPRHRRHVVAKHNNGRALKVRVVRNMYHHTHTLLFPLPATPTD